MLSIVIITYNEEHNIRRCLESVEGLGDEILVVDSGSLDSTADICRSMGATVIEQEFLGYIEQKNFATPKPKRLGTFSRCGRSPHSTSESRNSSDLSHPGADGYTMHRLTTTAAPGSTTVAGTRIPNSACIIVQKVNGQVSTRMTASA